MKKLIFIFLTALVGVSCTQKLHVEREPNVPIEKYHSYAWNKLEASNAIHPLYHNNELNQQIIREIDESFAKKGFKRNSVNPDFLVDFHIYVEEQKFQNTVCPAGFYRGERYLSELKENTYCESPQIVSYDDGTLIIDIVDARTKQLVWRASMNDLLESPVYAGKVFPKKVHRILKKFPNSRSNTRTTPTPSETEKQISLN